MDKKEQITKIINSAYEQLLENIKDGNFQAIKFSLENLDDKFSLQYRELLNGLFKNIITNINNFNGLNNINKVNVINIIKASFDNVL